MTRALPLLPALVLTACSGMSNVDLWRTVTSGRDGFQHPERVIEALELRPGDRVADIGAGDGYFLPWLSRAVGPDGRVYAVEVADERVEELRAMAEAPEFHDPKLPDGEIDLVFTCLTYHHIDERPAYFERLQRDLSASGRVAHLDDRDDLTGIHGIFLTDGHWSNVEQMNEEMSSAGYQRIAEFDFLPTQSFQIFTPVEATQD